MKGGKREVRKANVEFRMFVPSEAELVRWLEEERGGNQNMNAAIVDTLRLAHFLITHQPNISVNIIQQPAQTGYIPQMTLPDPQVDEEEQ